MDLLILAIACLVALAVVAYIIQNYVQIDAGLKNIILLVVVLVVLFIFVTRSGVLN